MIIDKIKNQVAKELGFTGEWTNGNRWKWAMMETNRKKAQLNLYEEVLSRLELAYKNAFMKQVGDNSELVNDCVEIEINRLHSLKMAK